MAKIDELKFDGKNFNKHNEYGMSLLGKSLQELGAGRSILIDKDNNIIAGNGIVEAAGQIGLDKVKIIETDGSEIIAVKRTDMRLDSKEGREMALADNATANVDLEWDNENLWAETEKWGIDMGQWGLSLGEDFEPADKSGDLDDETFLTSCYTKKQDIDNILFTDAITPDERVEGLKNKIEKCKNPELKKILEKRLNDFVDFNFDYIADYYLSGATDEEKELLVNFGLVIPTEKEAFINKFLDLERQIVLG